MSSIQINAWTRRGSMLVRTDALPYSDPEHPYNQVLALGRRPEDYGLEREDIKIIIGDRSKESLAAEILELRETVDNLLKNIG